MNWLLFTPELSMLFAALIFLVLSCLRPEPHRNYTVALTMAVLTVIAALAAVSMTGSLFNGSYRVDLFSQVFKVCLAMGFFLGICLCSELESVAPERHGEFYGLMALCSLAMMLMISGTHLLVIYLALEVFRGRT